MLVLVLHPIIISILFHHYKELKEYINQVEQIEEAKVNMKKKECEKDISSGYLISKIERSLCQNRGI